eukprot:4195917-Pleurochrysis_carterae.AAC.1
MPAERACRTSLSRSSPASTSASRRCFHQSRRQRNARATTQHACHKWFSLCAAPAARSLQARERRLEWR